MMARPISATSLPKLVMARSSECGTSERDSLLQPFLRFCPDVSWQQSSRTEGRPSLQIQLLTAASVL